MPSIHMIYIPGWTQIILEIMELSNWLEELNIVHNYGDWGERISDLYSIIINMH